jgi:hypothetical protein
MHNSLFASRSWAKIWKYVFWLSSGRPWTLIFSSFTRRRKGLLVSSRKRSLNFHFIYKPIVFFGRSLLNNFHFQLSHSKFSLFDWVWISRLFEFHLWINLILHLLSSHNNLFIINRGSSSSLHKHISFSISFLCSITLCWFLLFSISFKLWFDIAFSLLDQCLLDHH